MNYLGEMPKITWEQLWDVLEDFREWYEFEWLGETDIVDGGMNAFDYYINLKRTDPVWPDRPPQPR